MPNSQQIEGFRRNFGGRGASVENVADDPMERMRQNWGQKKMLPGPVLRQEMGTGEAWARVGGTWLLTRKTRVTESAMDRVTKEVIRRVQKLSGGVPILLPQEAEIAAEVEKIEHRYQLVTPYPDDGGPVGLFDMDEKIDSTARDLTRKAEHGVLDGEYPPTDEERAVARALWMNVGFVPPPALQKQLQEQVFGSAADVATKLEGGHLAEMKEAVQANIFRIARQKDPSFQFIVDPVTDWVLLSPEEREDLGDTTWGLTGTDLVVSRLKKGDEPDVMRIPLAQLGHRRNTPWLLELGFVDAVDLLRHSVGDLLRPRVQQIVNDRIGGTVNILSSGSEPGMPFSELMVRNPDHTIERLDHLARVVAGNYDMLELMTQRLREVDGRMPQIIRPNVVIAQLPDRTVMDLPISLVTGGRRNIAQEWRDMIQLRNDALRIINDMDRAASQPTIRNGRTIPPRIDPTKIGPDRFLESAHRGVVMGRVRQIRLIEERMQKLRQKDAGLPPNVSFFDNRPL
jgi:hypothetical protein